MHEAGHGTWTCSPYPSKTDPSARTSCMAWRDSVYRLFRRTYPPFLPKAVAQKVPRKNAEFKSECVLGAKAKARSSRYTAMAQHGPRYSRTVLPGHGAPVTPRVGARWLLPITHPQPPRPPTARLQASQPSALALPACCWGEAPQEWLANVQAACVGDLAAVSPLGNARTGMRGPGGLFSSAQRSGAHL